MKLKSYKFGMIAIASLAFLSVGCEDDHGNMMSADNNSNTLITNVYPVDLASGISTSSSIAVTFSAPVDTVSVMRNLYLSGGDEMLRWMDSAAHHGGVGHMSTRDMDDMMNWMDSIAMPGTITWNEAMDSCEFVPASGMLANREYMIFMYEGGMMDHNGGMMGSDRLEDQYQSYHFMTAQ